MSRDIRAVSPVIAVILMVAVTVVLSAVVGSFVFGISPSDGSSSTMTNGVRVTESTNSEGIAITEITVVSATGDSNLTYVVSGQNKTDIPDTSGTSVTLTSGVDYSKGDSISIIIGDRVVQSMTTGESSGHFVSEPTDMTHHWTLADDSTPSVATDSVGSMDGTIDNGTYVSTSERGTALSFDGISTDIKSGYALSASSGTISIWLKPNGNDDSGFDGIIGNRNDTSNDYEWQLAMRTDESLTLMSPPSTGVNVPSLMIGEWHHIVVTWNSSYVRGYHNSELVDEVTNPTLPSETDSPLIFGNYYDQTDYRAYDGNMSEVRVYDRSLTQTEVTDLYFVTK